MAITLFFLRLHSDAFQVNSRKALISVQKQLTKNRSNFLRDKASKFNLHRYFFEKTKISITSWNATKKKLRNIIISVY